MRPNVLIVRTAGTNCDRELAHAFELAGGVTQTVHLNALVADPQRFDEFDCVGFPGGFSYGDDIAAGRILANRLRNRLWEPIRRAIGRGVPMIGICNGFQALLKMGLLPDSKATGQAATLTTNRGGRFVDRWVGLAVPRQSCCIWTQGLGSLQLPIAHAEGRFDTADSQLPQRLEASGQVALRYEAGGNPNGSRGDIAGICDPSGLVLGLMPHPERYTDPWHHPTWTRCGKGQPKVQTTGLCLFRNALRYVTSQQVT